MSITTFISSIKWYDPPTTSWVMNPNIPASTLSPSEKSDIESWLTTIYNSSVSAKYLIDGSVSASLDVRIGGTSFPINARIKATSEFGNPQYLLYNTQSAKDVMYFNNNGIIVTEKPELTIIHEMIHCPSSEHSAQIGA